jgi:hypothetical protein
MDQYKAVVTEPNRPQPKPDKYGTLTIPPLGIYFGSYLGCLQWACDVLPLRTEGAFVTIYEIAERGVREVTREEAMKANYLDHIRDKLRQ